MFLTIWFILKDAFVVTLIAMALADFKQRNKANISRFVFIFILLLLALITNL